MGNLLIQKKHFKQVLDAILSLKNKTSSTVDRCLRYSASWVTSKIFQVAKLIYRLLQVQENLHSCVIRKTDKAQRKVLRQPPDLQWDGQRNTKMFWKDLIPSSFFAYPNFDPFVVHRDTSDQGRGDVPFSMQGQKTEHDCLWMKNPHTFWKEWSFPLWSSWIIHVIWMWLVLLHWTCLQSQMFSAPLPGICNYEFKEAQREDLAIRQMLKLKETRRFLMVKWGWGLNSSTKRLHEWGKCM